MLDFGRTRNKLREKIMNDNENPEILDEHVIISLKDYREANALPDDTPPEPTDGNDPKASEVYWAGRNLAMRRSARWAA
jgi:hypothetical protein